MTNYREGKSGVNVKRLAQNIADQYSFEPEMAAIVELMANACDAKASAIQIEFDKNGRILEVNRKRLSGKWIMPGVEVE